MFSLITAEEKQNSETEMTINAYEREYRRELLLDSLVLDLLAFTEDKMFLKRISHN